MYYLKYKYKKDFSNIELYISKKIHDSEGYFYSSKSRRKVKKYLKQRKEMERDDVSVIKNVFFLKVKRLFYTAFYKANRPFKLLLMKKIQAYVWKRNPDVRRRYLIERDTPYRREYPSEWHELSRAIHDNPSDPRNKTRIRLIYRLMCKYAYHYDSYTHYYLNSEDYKLHEKANEEVYEES